MRQKRRIITHAEALNIYFGGIHTMNTSGIPFTCKCGKNYYGPRQKKDLLSIPKQIALMHVEDCYKHIRKYHKERIETPPPPKPEPGVIA